MRITVNCHHVFFMALMVIMNCGKTPDNGLATRNDAAPKISGRLLQSDGTSPAKGALVTIRPAGITAPITGVVSKRAINTHSVYSNSSGAFSIDSCPVGVYVIEAQDQFGGKAVRVDSIVVSDSQSTTRVPPLSLQFPGTLRGNVRLSEGGDPSNVFILVFGSDRFVQAGSGGDFSMTDLPYGEYDLKIICLLREYGECLTKSVVIKPGDTLTLDTITLNAQGICIPNNVAVRFDSLRQIVTLHWDTCENKNVTGYNVYRYDKEWYNQYPKDPLNAGFPITGSGYNDSTVSYDRSYVYGVAALSGGNNEGRKSLPVTVTTRFWYHADTLDAVEGGGTPIGVYWKTDDELTVVYSVSQTIRIYRYGADLKIKQAPQTSFPFPDGGSFAVDNENIDLCNQTGDDSIVHGYDPNGQLRFECNLHRQIYEIDARNDMIFALTSDTGNYLDYNAPLTGAYDTSGKLLFSFFEDTNQLTHVVRVSDGSIYSWTEPSGLETGDKHLRRHDFATGQITECFIGSMEYWNLLDVNKNMFMFFIQYDRKLEVRNSQGELIARTDERMWPGFDKQGAINTRGRMAVIVCESVDEDVCDIKRVVVLTPP